MSFYRLYIFRFNYDMGLLSNLKLQKVHPGYTFTISIHLSNEKTEISSRPNENRIIQIHGKYRKEHSEILNGIEKPQSPEQKDLQKCRSLSWGGIFVYFTLLLTGGYK